jgi:hypothetical protein
MATAHALEVAPFGHDLPDDVAPTARCADLIRRYDWSATSLGDAHDWPVALRTMLATILRAPGPMMMLWGDDGVVLYNDAFASIAGARHPHWLGRSVRMAGRAASALADHVLTTCMAGEALRYRDHPLILDDQGDGSSARFDLDYSPIVDADDVPAGVLCVVEETTERTVAAQRSAFLLTLADDMRALGTPTAIIELVATRLGQKLAASRVFYAEITHRGWMTVERDYVRGVKSIKGRHSLESFGPDLLAAYRDGAPVVVEDVAGDER